MKRFHFPLQTVHNMREMVRDEAEKHLAHAASKVSEAESCLDEAGRSLTSAADIYAERLQSGTIDPHETALRADYIASLARREQEARARLTQLERELEERRLVVVEAARAAEATSKLRERQLARHTLEASRQEQNMLDEMATVSSARRLTDNP